MGCVPFGGPSCVDIHFCVCSVDSSESLLCCCLLVRAREPRTAAADAELGPPESLCVPFVVVCLWTLVEVEGV